MKTKLIATLSILMFVMTTSFAKDPESSMRKEITTQIEFPNVATDLQLEGAVFAEFIVKEDGKIEVVNCHSLVGELQSYVFQELAKMTVTPADGITGKTFLMRFDFKLI